jgi:chemotaxis protein MotA
MRQFLVSPRHELVILDSRLTAQVPLLQGVPSGHWIAGTTARGCALSASQSTAAGAPAAKMVPGSRLDRGFVIGLLAAAGATLAAIGSTGISLTYFLQPIGGTMVLGGTLGVLLITTPGRALLHSARRVAGLFSAEAVNREALIEEIVGYSRLSRFRGMAALEQVTQQAGHEFLRESLLIAMDVENRPQLEAALESKLRVKERQGEADAKALEVAGGFAPTLGILGTVIGLIDVLRQFSRLESVAVGIGTAFVSTIYGLGLANLVLLPAAHRIRARAAELSEVHEMIADGVVCLYDGVHPAVIRQRLRAYLREAEGQALAEGPNANRVARTSLAGPKPA